MLKSDGQYLTCKCDGCKKNFEIKNCHWVEFRWEGKSVCCCLCQGCFEKYQNNQLTPAEALNPQLAFITSAKITVGAYQ